MSTHQDVDAVEIARGINTDGIVACQGAFSREWVTQVREDVETAFDEARSREGGAVGRGPNRYYVEIHPQALRGFAELVDHPWVRAVSEAVLGPDYTVVEVGFDIPFAGAMNQPWHRDFPAPRATTVEGRLNSLAFNLTCVDTTEDMGPFEIAPGTQWLDSPDFEHGMFPPGSHWPEFEAVAVRKYPQMGDISARSALTIHRGTANHSVKSRPVLVVGMDAPDATNGQHHDLAVTPDYWERLPHRVRQHLRCPIVDCLQPIVQRHQIEGLVMGAP